MEAIAYMSNRNCVFYIHTFLLFVYITFGSWKIRVARACAFVLRSLSKFLPSHLIECDERAGTVVRTYVRHRECGL